MPAESPLLTAENLHKSYRKNAEKVCVLRGLDLEVYPGEFLAVVGASGSGKSTLLHLLGTLDRPDQGSIHLGGERAADRPGVGADRGGVQHPAGAAGGDAAPGAGAAV